MMQPKLHRRLTCLFTLLVATSTISEETKTRWSRQISSYTSDLGDWVPLAGPVARDPIKEEPLPIKRQAVAEPRILAEPFPGFSRSTEFNQDTFPSRGLIQSPPHRQLYLHSVPSIPSAPQNYLQDQGFSQSIRFGLTQPNYPLSQGFVGPQFPFDNMPPLKPLPQPVIKNPNKFENFPNNLALSPQAKPFVGQVPKIKLETQKFVDGYRLETANSSAKKKPQSLQKLKYDNLETIPVSVPVLENKHKNEREEVQLLYVPVESLNRGQFGIRNLPQPQIQTQFLNKDMYSQSLPSQKVKQTFAPDFQRPFLEPSQNYNFANFDKKYFPSFNSQIQNFDQIPKYSTITTPFPTFSPTTPKPKKLKPHQPPLAVFLAQEAKKGDQVKVGDVLLSLKNANTIAVLDAVNPINAPKVFIGPSSLALPDSFVKFELPYLSNIENSDKKLKQLPFFVAPLSYKTPDGFAKIPFPSPHVGSVVINSQIKETTTSSFSSNPTTYTSSTLPSKQESNSVSQKSNIAYYSTSPPKTQALPIQQSNYYSFEPQTVTSITPTQETGRIVTAPPKTGSYFLSDGNDYYNPSQVFRFPSHANYDISEPVKSFNKVSSAEISTTPRTITTPLTSTTSKPPSTYPSPLLETHNPYSINQAFQFSTPVDYQNYFEEYKENYATPGVNPSTESPPKSIILSNTSPNSDEENTSKQYEHQSSPNYLQNYTPEIQYESEVQKSRYENYNTNSYKTKGVPNLEKNNYSITSPANNNQDISEGQVNAPAEYNLKIENQGLEDNENYEVGNTNLSSNKDIINHNIYQQFENPTSYEESKDYTSSTSTSTTTTLKTPVRNRGRPRYTTESNESSTRTVNTRRPLRERRPSKPKYEPNRVTTERQGFSDSNEGIPKSPKSKTRGRVHYKPLDEGENYEKRNKNTERKEGDLAYQRDILHQNYPVTLMERTVSADIEAITEPLAKVLNDTTESYDTDNAYTNERATISQQEESQIKNTESKDDSIEFTVSPETQETYVPKLPVTSRNEEYKYPSRSSTGPSDGTKSNIETSVKHEDESNLRQTQTTDFATESTYVMTEHNVQEHSVKNEYYANKEDTTSTPNSEVTKMYRNQDMNNDNLEEKMVQTTPSYNKVRVRPGVIRKYHQTTSTESAKLKTNRNKPEQAITYRPAFEKRRTTMRIEEIQADLKTKQIHGHYNSQENRHPVYRPEAATLPSATTSNSEETTTKRGHFRRRKPSYTTTTTESPDASKNSYETKTRIRSRRPTEKNKERNESLVENVSTTVRSTSYKYSPRPRLSERFNKKSDIEYSEDQDLNYSVNIPQFTPLENETWSPKISVESFKPYNPNDISENEDIISTERLSNSGDIQEPDIITARNEYHDILISVTPTSNKFDRKIPDIPPTLEALVEQSKTTKSDSSDAMSTFESMLEEVMKSLEEKDEDEYTKNVVKHKGGEIGEIPPEKVISAGENYFPKSTTRLEYEATTIVPIAAESTQIDQEKIVKHKRQRGFWKKVKVRPLATESIEAAESQYYGNILNRLGESVSLTKTSHEKLKKSEKPSVVITTYKPTFHMIKEIFESESENLNAPVEIDLQKISSKASDDNNYDSTVQTTEANTEMDTRPAPTDLILGDEDVGTGSPGTTTISDVDSSSTEKNPYLSIDRSDSYGFMEYLLGLTPNDNKRKNQSSVANDFNVTPSIKKTNAENANQTTRDTKSAETVTTIGSFKTKRATTESTYFPEEITSTPNIEYKTDDTTEFSDIQKMNRTLNVLEVEKINNVTNKPEPKVETTSVSSFMDLMGIVSTSMSTEISHETEICFRGKCIKTNKNIL